MNIGLYAPDSKLPNLVLMKLSAFYKQKGYNVSFYQPLLNGSYDMVYVSKVFSKTKIKYFPRGKYEIGGTGSPTRVHLPEEIEHIYPDYSLYNIDYAMGFITRGCINHCPFCVVPKKEGYLRLNASLEEFWKDQSKLMLLDNAITDCPEAIPELCKIRDNKLKLNLTQGFNIRTISADTTRILADIHTWESYNQWHFSWDQLNDEDQIFQGIDRVVQNGIRKYKLMCYVLVGFNTTYQQDLYRIQKLRDYGIDPFVMPYRKSPYLNAVSKWVNNKVVFGIHKTFQSFIQSTTKYQEIKTELKL